MKKLFFILMFSIVIGFDSELLAENKSCADCNKVFDLCSETCQDKHNNVEWAHCVLDCSTKKTVCVKKQCGH